jgi:hypothetical protein
MAPTKEHHDIAAAIDKAVRAFPDTAGGMDTLCEQYPNLYRYAKLMEELAAAMAAGNFDDIAISRPFSVLSP